MRLSKSPFLLTCLTFGYGFLYLPITFLVVYSFNDSTRVTVWSRFSMRWYKELFQNDQILEALWVSLKIASVSATASVILGTLAAIITLRFKNFRGKTLFSLMISAPMVMPDMIMGLALLFLFIILQKLTGWPHGLGTGTITIAHITVSMAYVFVVVRARLSDFDRSLEEAALDLGARPTKVFFLITLPIIAPALVAGWLLAFTLSLDDVVIASFLSGPGATTLPMIIFSSVRFGVSPLINALATIIILVVTTGVIAIGLITYRQSRHGSLRKDSSKS